MIPTRGAVWCFQQGGLQGKGLLLLHVFLESLLLHAVWILESLCSWSLCVWTTPRVQPVFMESLSCLWAPIPHCNPFAHPRYCS